MSHAVFNKHPMNRENKRARNREIDRYLAPLHTVEAAFLTALFSEDDKRTYSELFHHFGRSYKNTLESLLKGRKPTFLTLNEGYFSRYKPQA